MIAELQTSSASEPRADVLAAIRDASAKTGSDFAYLLGTAMRESSLDTQAKSKASSATGLFQFIDQTWLGLVKRYGEKHGLGDYAKVIGVDGNGHYTVASRDTKTAILALRKDPQLSALMAGEAANETKQSLECSLGRSVCGGELYAAHFLGEGGARHLIALKDKNPACPADQLFPQAAKANRSIFYRQDGTPKTVKEVYDWAVDLPAAPALLAKAKAGTHQQPAAMAAVPKPGALVLASSATPTQAPALRQSLTVWSRPNAAPQPSTAMLPRPTLMLSPGVLEILAAFTKTGRFAANAS